MRLPNAANAIVERDKIARYGSHTRGRGKAQFFLGFGFSPEATDAMRQALLRHAGANDAVSVQRSEHGTKYTVQGPLPAPDGRAPVVKSVWIIDQGGQTPRFVTAFPGPRQNQ
jgi:hypothetical protein